MKSESSEMKPKPPTPTSTASKDIQAVVAEIKLRRNSVKPFRRAEAPDLFNAALKDIDALLTIVNAFSISQLPTSAGLKGKTENADRKVFCIWCGQTLYTYNAPPPAEDEAAACIEASRNHEPCEKNPARKVIEFVAYWRGLYALHRNVEEGDYLACLRCSGESVQHGRNLTPADVAHDKGCPIALAQAIIQTTKSDASSAVSIGTGASSVLHETKSFESSAVPESQRRTPAIAYRNHLESCQECCTGLCREGRRLWEADNRHAAEIRQSEIGSKSSSADASALAREIWDEAIAIVKGGFRGFTEPVIAELEKLRDRSRPDSSEDKTNGGANQQ